MAREIYTTSVESEARQTLETFEQARDFFRRVQPSLPGAQLPVTIVAFDDLKQYKPYAVRPSALAYYAGGEQRDYIVMGDLGVERRRVAIHEYVHLLVRRSELRIPLWLNEGLAEVYSTMEAADGRIHLGAMSKDRIWSLTHQSWLRLPVLAAADDHSPVYTGTESATIFYAQSWLLTHMLLLGEGWSGKFPAFLDRVSSTGSTAAGFADIYGLSLAQVEREMNLYFRQNTIGGAGYRSDLRKGDLGPARAATELEIGVTLAQVLALAGRPAEAERRLAQLAASHPPSGELEEARAYLEWSKGNREGALRHLEAALERGAASWKTRWDYARLLHAAGGDRARRLQAARTALAARPDLAEARLLVGVDLYELGRYEESLAELKRIQTFAPEYAARAYLVMAQAAQRLKQAGEARGYAELARKHARRPEEVSGAEWILNHPQGDEETQRPILRRRAAPE